MGHSCRSSSGVSSWWDQTDRQTDRQTGCCRSAALACCAGAKSNSCLRLNNKAEQRSKSLTQHCFLLCITDWILDAMVKQRRVRARSCCAAVAPLCSRRGPRQVSRVFSESYITTLQSLCVLLTRQRKVIQVSYSGKQKKGGVVCVVRSKAYIAFSFLCQISNAVLCDKKTSLFMNGCDCELQRQPCMTFYTPNTEKIMLQTK